MPIIAGAIMRLNPENIWTNGSLSPASPAGV
jgi:hypothetical protein